MAVLKLSMWFPTRYFPWVRSCTSVIFREITFSPTASVHLPHRQKQVAIKWMHLQIVYYLRKILFFFALDFTIGTISDSALDYYMQSTSDKYYCKALYCKICHGIIIYSELPGVDYRFHSITNPLSCHLWT